MKDVEKRSQLSNTFAHTHTSPALAPVVITGETGYSLAQLSAGEENILS